MTLTVADLVTVFGPMFATLLAVVVTMMRYQHVDGNKTRELITDSSRENREYADKLNQETRELIKDNRDLIDKNHQETRELIKETNQETRDLIKDNRDLIDKNHQELSGGLNEVRRGLAKLGERVSKLGERVASIEGFLKLWPTPPPPPEDGDAQPA